MTGTEATSGGEMRLDGRVALLVGGGQTPGQTTGNGRAAAITYARAGARVLVADRSLHAAEETVRDIVAEGGEAIAFEADVTREGDIRAMIAAAASTWGQLDIIYNNVGISVAGGDAEISEIESDAFDGIMAINLRAWCWPASMRSPSCESSNPEISSISPRQRRMKPIRG